MVYQTLRNIRLSHKMTLLVLTCIVLLVVIGLLAVPFVIGHNVSDGTITDTIMWGIAIYSGLSMLFVVCMILLGLVALVYNTLSNQFPERKKRE